MKIEYLETFILLSEVKSFSKLALDLGISQSTLSHRITELEKEFGQIRFINRTTRKFELTEEGQIFLEYAKKIANKEDMVVITGSLFTVGEARSLLLI